MSRMIIFICFLLMFNCAECSTKPNKAALKWACIFSSYVACATVAGGVGVAGAAVGGPFGVAVGFAGGLACRYVFQTFVEKYGSKGQACKILSKANYVI